MKLSRRRSDARAVPSAFAQTLARAKDGDGDAVTDLYLEHVAMVYGYLRACRVSDAEDLTSDVFVGMLRNLHRFQGTAAEFRSWLMTIAHRRLIDHQRRSVRNRSEPAEPSVLETQALGGTAELRPLAMDRELVEAFGQLTAAQREVLALRFLADVSLQDVATIVGRPVTSVKSLQNRALAALRRHIGPGTPEGAALA